MDDLRRDREMLDQISSLSYRPDPDTLECDVCHNKVPPDLITKFYKDSDWNVCVVCQENGLFVATEAIGSLETELKEIIKKRDKYLADIDDKITGLCKKIGSLEEIKTQIERETDGRESNQKESSKESQFYRDYVGDSHRDPSQCNP